jgi:hypothetical protein
MELLAHVAVVVIVALAAIAVVIGIARLVKDAVQQVRAQRFLEDYNA